MANLWVANISGSVGQEWSMLRQHGRLLDIHVARHRSDCDVISSIFDV